MEAPSIQTSFIINQSAYDLYEQGKWSYSFTKTIQKVTSILLGQLQLKYPHEQTLSSKKIKYLGTSKVVFKNTALMCPKMDERIEYRDVKGYSYRLEFEKQIFHVHQVGDDCRVPEINLEEYTKELFNIVDKKIPLSHSGPITVEKCSKVYKIYKKKPEYHYYFTVSTEGKKFEICFEEQSGEDRKIPYYNEKMFNAILFKLRTTLDRVELKKCFKRLLSFNEKPQWQYVFRFIHNKEKKEIVFNEFDEETKNLLV
ncbi:hypothetical protein BN1013_01437 [Candidatus Rubidus massiliensis]|nr:MAG: hypothetical protein BGO10_04575 [Chlamydia sp. 32-24]CDZ80910.1 hypothetical protein BN1013_01437 [Candidatus Rubidus massiliensis]